MGASANSCLQFSNRAANMIGSLGGNIPMKFGIFYEHQLPRDWNSEREHQLLKQSLSQIELADELGFEYAWEGAHQFLEEYSHSSGPGVVLAAARPRT